MRTRGLLVAIAAGMLTLGIALPASADTTGATDATMPRPCTGADVSSG